MRIASGHRDLADVVQLGGVADLLDLVVAELSPRGRLGEVGDAAEVVRSSGLRSASARSSTSLLWRLADVRPAFFCAYMRWSAIRSASATSLASPGSSIAP